MCSLVCGPQSYFTLNKGGNMKLAEAIKKAVNEKNYTIAGKVSDFLRDKFNMNYNEVYEYVNKLIQIDRADWEELMYESDI